MTVKEMIEQLSMLDPELHVFVSGYEGGYHYAKISNVKDISLHWHTEWYYGPHELTTNVPGIHQSQHEQVKGIVL